MTEKLPRQNPLSITDGELLIDMQVFDGICNSFCSFTGTREQIEAEGLVPSGIEWIPGPNGIKWTVGELTYILRQFKPRNAKKGICNLWMMRIHSYTHVPLHRLEAKILERRLIALERSQTPEALRAAECQRDLLAAAASDQAFQSFKHMLPGVVRTRRARSIKAEEMSHG